MAEKNEIHGTKESREWPLRINADVAQQPADYRKKSTLPVTEDSVIFQPGHGFFGILDGVGGESGGALASYLSSTRFGRDQHKLAAEKTLDAVTHSMRRLFIKIHEDLLKTADATEKHVTRKPELYNPQAILQRYRKLVAELAKLSKNITPNLNLTERRDLEHQIRLTEVSLALPNANSLKTGQNTLKKMATTATVLQAYNDGGKLKFVIGHVGDSRVYSVHQDNSIEQLTEDTKSTMESPGFLGYGSTKPPYTQISVIEPKSGDALVIVCDGVYGCLTPDQLAKLVNFKGDSTSPAARLVDRQYIYTFLSRFDPKNSRKPMPDDDRSAIVLKLSST